MRSVALYITLACTLLVSSVSAQEKQVATEGPAILASQFQGTGVLGADNQKVGDVVDILFERDGKISAFIVAVGGFLGVGTKEIALEPSKFRYANRDASNILRVQLTKAEFWALPGFRRPTEKWSR